MNSSKKKENARSTKKENASRVVDKHGQVRFTRIGAPRAPLSDIYHSLLLARYPTVVLVLGAIYLAANLFFASLFLLGETLLNTPVIEGARPGSFVDAFYFSTQTMTTIGYGGMSPIGNFANLLVSVEAFLGLMGFAIATGLLFAKLSRPSSRVLFADRLVVDHWHDGVQALKLRVANARSNQIAEAVVTLTLIWNETLDDGTKFRRFHNLALVRDRSPILTLTWTLIHPLDETSPLYGLDREALEERRAELLLSISGIDETFAQGVQARRGWVPSEIDWQHSYLDMLTFSDTGLRSIDYGQIHATRPHADD